MKKWITTVKDFFTGLYGMFTRAERVLIGAYLIAIICILVACLAGCNAPAEVQAYQNANPDHITKGLDYDGDGFSDAVGVFDKATGAPVIDDQTGKQKIVPGSEEAAIEAERIDAELVGIAGLFTTIGAGVLSRLKPARRLRELRLQTTGIVRSVDHAMKSGKIDAETLARLKHELGVIQKQYEGVEQLVAEIKTQAPTAALSNAA